MSLTASENQQRHSGEEWLLLGGIAMTILAREWNYSLEGYALPAVLYYGAWAAGLLLPLFAIISLSRFAVAMSAGAILKRCLFLGLGCLLVLWVQSAIHPDAVSSYDLWTLIQFAAMPLWGLAGFLVIAQARAAAAFLTRLAACAAWASLYSYSMRLAQIDQLPFGAAGWPTRLFILFGFCWYLSQVLLVPKARYRARFGLFACSLETVFTLHKPIMFAALFAVATLVIITFRQALNWKVVKRMATLLLPIILVLIAVNTVTRGAVVEAFTNFVYERVLRLETPDDDISLRRASSGRLDMWEAALTDLKENAWFGTGIKYLPTETGTISLHNGYLDLAFILGIAGFSLVFLGVWLWFKSVLRSMKYQPLRPMQSACLAFVVGILAFNLGGTSRLFPGPSYFIMLICGLSLRLAVVNWPTPALTRKPEPSRSSDMESRQV